MSNSIIADLFDSEHLAAARGAAARRAAGQDDELTTVAALTAALRERDEQLRKMSRAVEQSPAMILITDTTGTIQYVNPKFTEVTGYASEEVVGERPSILKSGEHGPDIYERMWRTILSGGEWRGELRNRKKSGELFWELASISPIRDEAGTITHFIAVKEDITDRKSVEHALVVAREQAVETSRAKSEFLANMSHEIRTPMNAIIGMADLLWETELTDEQREYVRVFRRAGSTLLNLINDILDLSKVEAGRLSLTYEDFDLSDLLEKTCEVMAVPAHEKEVELVCHVKPGVPAFVSGDPTRLRQVLTNLIGNAIKFTDRGEVVVEVGADESAVEQTPPGQVRLHFSVRDTGIGISKDKLEAIFDRFTQAGPDMKRNASGAGLGLAISKRLVELMAGQIWAESEIGYGSTFQFTASFGVRTEPEIADPTDADLKGLRVLVVDDNSTNRFILREMLNAWGTRVETVSGGRLALLELRKAKEQGDPYRLALLDCHMPDMDGFQLAERIKAELGSTELAVIMLTSDRLNWDVNRIRDIGISNYLVKPVKRSDLLKGIASAIGKPRVREDVAEPGNPADGADLRPLNILLVEDSEDSRLLIQSYLKKTPYTLDFAENGQIAVEKFQTFNYDIVLMDTQMPVMDGSAATRAIRAWEAAHNVEPTPIVALTAYALPEDAERSLQAGCNAHLSKPVKRAKLIETIRDNTEPWRADEALAAVEPADKIVVRPDPEIMELIPHYLENRENELAFLRSAVALDDFEAIRSIGHAMKGTGGGYGFEEISMIGWELEQAAVARDRAASQACVDRLGDYLARVEVVLD